MASLSPRNLRPAPRVGLLLTSNGVFDPAAKNAAETWLRQYLQQLISDGSVEAGSIASEHVSTYQGARAAVDQFVAAVVDLVVIANVAFPVGHVLVTVATDPHLKGIPIAVLSEFEANKVEWETNAWCGAIMNNYVGKQMDRPIAFLHGPFKENQFDADFRGLLKVAGTMKALRRDFLGRIGEAPGGFHSASGNLLAFAQVFGTQVDTCDLTAVMEAYRTGKATGYNGTSTFNDRDLQDALELVKQDRTSDVDEEMLQRGVRMFAAYRAVIRANGYTSVAFRCWPEINEAYIGVSACLTVSLLLGTGEVTAASCESDWPIAVMQSVGALLSGRPAACLDWVNYTGASEIVQLGHCGVGICGEMACEPCKAGAGFVDTIDVHPVIRVGASKSMGPVHIGQYAYGVKTGISLLQDRAGKFKMLVFRGESSPDTAKGMRYSAADMLVPEYKKLHRLIMQHGFPHHVAMAQGDITRELKTLCNYLDIEYISPIDDE